MEFSSGKERPPRSYAPCAIPASSRGNCFAEKTEQVIVKIEGCYAIAAMPETVMQLGKLSQKIHGLRLMCYSKLHSLIAPNARSCRKSGTYA